VSKKAETEEIEETEEITADESFGIWMKEFDKSYPGELKSLDSTEALDVEIIPTGVIALDVALGVGGLPRGRIVEVYGPTGGGKTTLALTTAVQCLKMSPTAKIGFVDCEQALSIELCEALGLPMDRYYVIQPDVGEQAVDMVERMVKSRNFDMVIVDSVAAMVPSVELEADLEGSVQMGRHGKLMSTFMKRVAAPTKKSNTLLMLLNQTRVNLGAYGAPDTPTGGKAVGFYSSVRIEVRTSASKQIKKGTDVIGTRVTSSVKKNKVAAPFKKCEYDIIFGKGISEGGSLLEACTELGIIDRKGSSYFDTRTGERIGIGKDAVGAILEEAPIGEEVSLGEQLRQAVYDTMAARRTRSVEDVLGPEEIIANAGE